MTDHPLQDEHGRFHDYLRISLTERCNLRCFYCMPEEGVQLLPKEHYMSTDELVHMAEEFVRLGVKKIRLTGGEPLLRKDIGEILERLSALPIQLGLTTNGILLDRYLPQIKRLDIKLNLSLDSLNSERNFKIVKRDYFDRIMANLDLALSMGVQPSINCVLMSNINEDEVIDFIELTKQVPIDVRFIEFMPFNGNQWQLDKCVPDAVVLEKVRHHYGIDKVHSLDKAENYIAREYQIEGYTGKFGLISTVTEPFCQACNRIRLTADGKLKNCLFDTQEVDLLTPLRQGKDIVDYISDSVHAKHAVRGGIISMDDEHLEQAEDNRSMIRIGG